MKGYQMICKGRGVYFDSSERTFINPIIYLNKESITQDRVARFKESCIDGDGLFDLDEKTIQIKVIEVEIYK